MSMSHQLSQSEPLPAPNGTGSGPRRENRDRPTLAAELLLRKAGLRNYGRLDLLEDRLLWLVRSDRGLAFLNSEPWPPAFLQTRSGGEGNESDPSRAACVAQGMEGGR